MERRAASPFATSNREHDAAKKPTKKPAPRAKPRRAKAPAQSGAPSRGDFSAIVELVADAKESGAFDPKNRPRNFAKPTVANTPGAPFARIVAGAKTEDQQLRALETAGPAARHKVTNDDIAVGRPVELIVLACKSNALRCRLLGIAREVTLRTAVRDEVPGGIITVMPTKQWTHARHAYLAGNVLSIRADVEALGLEPLAVHEQGEWDPEREYWGEAGEPIDEWAKPIIARGRRPMFEMEQVLPGADPEDFDSDPIVEASELNAVGDRAGAREVLMKLLGQDLRCLDAHAHLGNFAFGE